MLEQCYDFDQTRASITVVGESIMSWWHRVGGRHTSGEWGIQLTLALSGEVWADRFALRKSVKVTICIIREPGGDKDEKSVIDTTDINFSKAVLQEAL